ncbi:MAG: DUF3592 domain-containing protein, partial [Verrucomicrobia bacterium]|nr:DUF3592 domain-containing protein [Verrucomicrobiota bacterium]
MAFGIKLDQQRIGHQKGGGAASTGCGVLFDLVFALFGLVFAGFLGKIFLDDLRTYFWAAVPCELGSAEIAVDSGNQDDPFELLVQYRYEFEGSSFESTQHHRTGFGNTSQDYTALARELGRLRTDQPLRCYVNPDNPSEAILRRGSLLMGLVILFPLIFVMVGTVVIVGSVRQKQATVANLEQGSISQRAIPRKRGNRIAFVVLGIFLLVGGGLMYPLLILPVTRAVAAKHWPEVECQIIWSRVDSHSGDDGTTYSVNIFYQYVFEGETFRSNRYGYFGGSSSGSAGKQAIVSNYPEGSTQLCWVNPKDPLYAVLKRELGWGAFLRLIPGIFFMIGALGLVSLLRKIEVRTETVKGVKWAGGSLVGEGFRGPLSATSRNAQWTVGSGGAPREIKAGSNRVIGFLGICLINAFWNGIVSVFVW